MVSAKGVEARLKAAKWLRRGDVQQLLRLLDGAAGRTRAVGGVVRDTVLGLPIERSDIDLATELVPTEVIACAAAAGIPSYPTGIEHGTVTLRHGDLVAEVTTLRLDVETDGRRAKVTFGNDWAADAARRDFTLNALYLGMDGTLFDPLNGLADCLAARVRFIGDPDTRIAEDRLRVFRFFRFSASHGGEKFDAGGYAACARAAGSLGALSPERVGGEMRRILGLPKITTTLKAMCDAGVLSLDHQTLERLASYGRRAHRANFPARLALLLAPSDAPDFKSMWRLSNDEIASAQAILSVARLLAAYALNEAAYRHPAALADGVEVAAILAGWTDAGRSTILDQLQSMTVPRFPVTGADLIAKGLAPGPALGQELERLEHLWIESGFTLDRGALLAQAKR